MIGGAATARKQAPLAAPRDALAFVGDASTRDAVARAFRDSNLPATAIVDGGIDAALKQAEPGAMPRILVVDVSSSSAPAADVAALAAVVDPGTRIVVIGAVNDVALFRDLLGVGATDYLVKPLDPHLLHAALTDGDAALKSGRAPSKLARVAAFVGARGGVGATTLAVNIGWLLAQERRHKTALIDLDLHFGTTILSLDLEPGRGLREALERPGRIDSLFMERAMAKAGDRLFVLGCEEPLRENPAIDPTALETLLGELRQNFDWIVLDMPRAFLSGRSHTLAVATDVVLVGDQSLAGIRDTMRILDVVKEHAPQARVRLAATSADGSRPKVSRADFERSVARKLDYEIPFDPKTIAAGANAGKPLTAVARNGKLVKTLRRLSVDLAGADARKKSAGLLRRWISR